MDACVQLRRSILASLGLTVAACSSDRGPVVGAEVDIPAPASGKAEASAVPSARHAIVDPLPHDELGYVVEEDGTRHRAAALSCDKSNDRPSCKGTEQSRSCNADSDCKDGPNGKCITGKGWRGGDYCGCSYTCESDADCGAGKACMCKKEGGEALSICVAASCKTDTDCASGTCGVSDYSNGCGRVVELACRAQGDACKTSHDCEDKAGARGPESCAYVNGSWGCHGRTCVIGRPFFVDGAACSAPTASRGDWSAAIETGDPFLRWSADEKRLGAEHWLAIAALEHASVASFARFTLQLLSLGAPSELVRDSQQASLDEIEHARIAYEIASRLVGAPVGPDRLREAVAASPGAVSEIAFALVREGCVGETLGALEARLQADACDPSLRAPLLRIAADETRHAELAWRSLAWMIDAFGEEARAAAERAFAEAVVALGTPGIDQQAIHSLGMLGGEELGRIRRQALSEVVQPAWKALGRRHLTSPSA